MVELAIWRSPTKSERSNVRMEWGALGSQLREREGGEKAPTRTFSAGKEHWLTGEGESTKLKGKQGEKKRQILVPGDEPGSAKPL